MLETYVDQYYPTNRFTLMANDENVEIRNLLVPWKTTASV